MTTLTDNRDLSFKFPDGADAFVFDQMKPQLPNFHGIDEMARVDFIVELSNEILFIEVKDPSNPNARLEGIKKFYDSLNDNTLCENFAKKFMDSFVYRWAENKVTKPVHYLCLVTIDSEQLQNLTDQIINKLPPIGIPVARWQRSFLQNCQVFNIETWNENFPKWPVSRISASVPTNLNANINSEATN